MDILSVNGFIKWRANISGSIRGLFCLVFFYCWLALCSVKICVWQRSFMICLSLWKWVLLPLALPTEINCSQLKTWIRLRFLLLNSNGSEQKELSPLEGFSVSFRIPEGNSKKAWKPKRKGKRWEELKSTRRILYYIQNSRREFKVSKSWKRR